MAMKPQIILFRKHASVIVLLLIVLLAFTWNLNLVSASSGGVAGGSFFDSDSDSSFSTDSDSDSEYTKDHHHHHHHYMHHSPPYDHDEHVHKHHANVVGSVPILFFMVFTVGMFFMVFCNKHTNGNAVTVFKLQVGMLDEMGCTIKRDLTRIAEAADTSSKEGVTNLLKETIQALDQHHGFCIAGYSSVDLKRSKEDGKTCYNQLSIEEREKFDEETLVNLDDNNKTRIRSQSYDQFSNEYSTFDMKKSSEETEEFEKEKLLGRSDKKYIVIILLVAVKGAHKLPNINNGGEDLKKALQKLKSLLSSNLLLAGEVLWTPQKDHDILLDQKLLKDYPQLAKRMLPW